ncbi:4Fe-4S dicluster domain-containing protein [Dinghuibacter silviterrae]|uniref:4Fe-4S dicluster protein n=1 Tax=Dinghuibacter silviterrae TaxID=1539049 RepID=A0A4R8DYD6_9BACT|nr:4Fe-4S dicluster domain-containing protein [Dinghuibacter silviterrae]TDX02231.1 4Fe-4S dicluster protein [Dinghuibacter silviterrae]
MHVLQEIVFIVVLIGAVGLFAAKIREIRQNIGLGKPGEPVTQKGRRWRYTLLYALGQKRLFRYPMVGVLHFFIYAGFIIINLEILEIIVDGVLGTHRVFAPVMGAAYAPFIGAFEVLAVLVLFACIVFLIRRNILHTRRLNTADLNGWPRKDANIILITESILMLLFLTMDACDPAGGFAVSRLVRPGWSPETMETVARTCWWLHILGILAFLNYLPYSKHFHIILGFPNTFYAPLDEPGKMHNMPDVQKEVEYVFHPELAPSGAEAPQHFGAKDVFQLSRLQLLQAYSCTECGRCSAACPANQTGKKLSPRKIMMDTRDRLEEVGRNVKKNGAFQDDGKTLLHGYVSPEELRACTTCNACVQECPVSISPLSIILELRRALVMEESNAPAEWNAMFSNVENNFAPWKFSPDDRAQWTQD